MSHLVANCIAACMASVIAVLVIATHAYALTPSGPIVISGQNGRVISGLNVSSTTGPCVQIINSRNVTIEGSNIGPCGVNNSTANSWGIYISGGGNLNIHDNYIHVENRASRCGHTHDGIFITNKASGVAIQNVIAYGQSNIMTWDASDISVIGNFLLNPRGSAACPGDAANLGGTQFQAWSK